MIERGSNFGHLTQKIGIFEPENLPILTLGQYLTPGPEYSVPNSSICGVCFAWPLMKESKDQSANGKCENQIKDELAGAHDKPKSQNIVRRKSNLPQV